MNRWIDKDPADEVEYAIDWSGALSDGDVITDAAWSVTPSGLTLAGVEPVVGQLTRAKVSGGTAGVTYVVTCTVTTFGTDVLERNIMLKVREQ